MAVLILLDKKTGAYLSGQANRYTPFSFLKWASKSEYEKMVPK